MRRIDVLNHFEFPKFPSLVRSLSTTSKGLERRLARGSFGRGFRPLGDGAPVSARGASPGENQLDSLSTLLSLVERVQSTVSFAELEALRSGG